VATPPSAGVYASLPATPSDSRPVSGSRPPSQSRMPTPQQDELAEGLEELKRAGSQARLAAQQAAEEARATVSSRQSSRGLGTPKGSAGQGPLGSRRDSREAEHLAVSAMFGPDDAGGAGGSADDFEAQREALAAEMEAEKQRALEAAVAAKEGQVAALEAAREQLVSAQSERRSVRTPPSPKDKAADAQLSAQIMSVEAKLAAEKEALKLLADEKRRHDEERRGLEAQLGKTMQMFQEQLAHTVRMAAMLQAQRIMTGAPPEAAPDLPTVPLPQEVDEPPSPEEVEEYASYLGFDLEADPDLLYIAEWALTAPVPEGWTVHLDGEGHEFFHNAATAVSTYEHPMDEHYKQYYLKKREEKRAAAAAAGQPKLGARKQGGAIRV